MTYATISWNDKKRSSFPAVKRWFVGNDKITAMRRKGSQAEEHSKLFLIWFLPLMCLQPQFQKPIRFTNVTLLANHREYVCITTW